MKWKLWLGTILDFFLLWPGYLLFTPKKLLGLLLTVGAVLATYVEQVPLKALEDQTPLKVMFVAFAFFSLALGCATDGYQEIKKAVGSR